MRYIFSLFLSFFIVSPLSAQWQKLNDVDYTWGPFKIYNLSIFSETGDYTEGMRPLMLTFKYDKPVEGRDFAISIARSWANLDINPANKDVVIERLRKNMPNLKSGDKLHYIALNDRGYFILNNQVIPEEFKHEFNDAILSVWLDPKVDIGSELLKKWRDNSDTVGVFDPSLAEEPQVAHIEVDGQENHIKINSPKPLEQPNGTEEQNLESEVYPPFDNVVVDYIS